MKRNHGSYRILLLFFTLTLQPLLATKTWAYAVATGTSWSTEAATEILNKGGNATDAMVAAAFALNVAQPYNMGIGGGGFFLVTTGGKTRFLDSRETAPASATEKMFLGPTGEPIPYYPERVTGPNPVGIPGTVAGLYEAHRKLGRLPWKTVLAPAIRLAKEGVPVTRSFEETLAEEWDRIKGFPVTAALFGNGENGPAKAGQILKNPMLARTLERIAQRGAREFYEGELARSWLAEANRFGVRLTAKDLSGYQVKERAPLEYKMFGLRALSAPPPSGGSLVLAGALRYLERTYATRKVPEPGSAIRIATTTEALGYFQELRNKTIGEPPAGTLDPQRFLGSADEKKAWAEIDRRVALRLQHLETAVTQHVTTPKALAATALRGHTAHLSIVDNQGMAVAYTTTIEQWFGSGIAVTGHGFLLNNELSDFSPEPGLPNSPAPGKRPRSNMTPTLLFSGKDLVGVVGAAGGGKIPLALVLLLENYYIHKMPARQAIAFPRFIPEDGKLLVDKAVLPSVVAELKNAGYTVEVTDVGANAQAILRRSPGQPWEAASDPRADGLALRVP